MPTWFSKELLAPLDVQQPGYPSLEAFKADFAPAFVAGASQGDKIYGHTMLEAGGAPICPLPCGRRCRCGSVRGIGFTPATGCGTK